VPGGEAELQGEGEAQEHHQAEAPEHGRYLRDGVAGGLGDHRPGRSAQPPEGHPGRLFDSVTSRLFVLPSETLVYPGFDAQGRQVSSIGQERAINQRFAGRGRDAFVTLMASLAGDPLLLPSPDGHTTD